MDKISQDLARAAAATVPGRAGFDYLIVGARVAGSVLGQRQAHLIGKRVLLVVKRPHKGGKAKDP
jgi:hypothetical protein